MRLTPRARRAIEVVCVAGVLICTAWLLYLALTEYFFNGGDAQIYVNAVRHWWAGEGLYDFANEIGFGFTYPPFAALVVSAVAWLPGRAASLAFQIVVLVGVFVLVAIVVRSLKVRDVRFATLVIGTGLVFSYPVLREFVSGQVDIVLAIMVAVDLLVLRGTRYQGLLTGVAAAIKLTPAAFGLFFVADKQLRPVINAAIGGLGATAIGFLVSPGASIEFWTRRLWETERVGHVAVALNQNLAAVVVRAFRTESFSGTGRSVWAGLVLATIALGWWAIRRALKARVPALGFAVAGLVMLLISPISWLHHWAFVVVVFTVLAIFIVRTRGVWWIVAALLGLPVLVLAPWWLFGPAVTWVSLPLVLAGSYPVIWAVFVLVVAATAPLPSSVSGEPAPSA